MAEGYWRGHKIEELDTGWVYLDTGQKVKNLPDRRCGTCKLPNRRDGHDACLGEIEGAMNACCGHGHDKPYIQWNIGGTNGQPKN